MPGHYLMHRGWFNNPVFRKEAFCERMAWVWLIEEAAWKPYRKRAGNKVVNLKRGQLAASTRFMANAWGWPEAKVRRFVKRLQDDGMVEVVSDAGVNVVSVCKYNNYQLSPSSTDAAPTQGVNENRRSTDAPTDAPADAAEDPSNCEKSGYSDAPTDAQPEAQPTQHRRSTDANQNEGNEGNEVRKGDAQARAAKDYAFVGYVIRLNARDFEQWRQSYHAIPDLMAELRSLDHYYAENPPKDGRWFHRVSRCLKDKHERNLQRQSQRESEREKMFRQCI